MDFAPSIDASDWKLTFQVSFIYLLMSIDYSKLRSTYLYYTCAHKAGEAYTHIVNPT